MLRGGRDVVGGAATGVLQEFPDVIQFPVGKPAHEVQPDAKGLVNGKNHPLLDAPLPVEAPAPLPQ